MLHMSSHITEVVEYSCNLAPDLMGEYIEGVSTGMDTYSIKQPLGVCPRMVFPSVRCRLPCCSPHIWQTCSLLNLDTALSQPMHSARLGLQLPRIPAPLQRHDCFVLT